MTRRASLIDFMNGYVSEIFTSFQGEGPFAGRRHVFLRMAGCNLRCVYCDTPGSLERTPFCDVENGDGSSRRLPNPLAAAELRAIVDPLLCARAGVHALAITGGEPLLQSPFLFEMLAAARPPVAVLLETNGTLPGNLERLLPLLDVVSMDVKLPSNSHERALWAEHREFLRIAKRKTVYVKVPVDDGTPVDELRRAVDLVEDVAPDAAFFLQPILREDGTTTASAEALARLYDVAVSRLRDVRVLPQAHKALGIR
jgi:7-carboxy-7-deazaguanine synthase